MSNTTEENSSFDAQENAFLYLMVVACFIGIICNIRTLFYETLDLSEAKNKTPHRIMIFIIFVTDFIWMVGDFIVFLYQGIEQRFIDGVACYYIPFSAVFLAGGSCVTMAYIAYERYRLIVQEKATKTKSMVIALSLIWSWAFVLGSLPLYYSDPKDFGISRTKTGIFCMMEWYNPRPEGRFHGIASVLTCGISIGLTAFFYTRIYARYREITDNVSNSARTPSEEEKKVIYKLVGIVMLFSSCWLLYFFLMLFQSITNEPSDGIFEGIATLCVYINPTVNALFYSYPRAEKVAPAEEAKIEVSRGISKSHLRAKSSGYKKTYELKSALASTESSSPSSLDRGNKETPTIIITPSSHVRGNKETPTIITPSSPKSSKEVNKRASLFLKPPSTAQVSLKV